MDGEETEGEWIPRQSFDDSGLVGGVDDHIDIVVPRDGAEVTVRSEQAAGEDEERDVCRCHGLDEDAEGSVEKRL